MGLPNPNSNSNPSSLPPLLQSNSVNRRQKAIAFFVALCVLLVAAAISLNIGWIVTNAGRVNSLILGILAIPVKLDCHESCGCSVKNMGGM